MVKASQLFLQIINLLQLQISCDGRCLQLNSFAMLSLCQHVGTWHGVHMSKKAHPQGATTVRAASKSHLASPL